MITETLYQFDYPKGTFALQFKNKDDADLMKVKIMTQAPKQKEFDEMKAFIKEQELAAKKEEDKNSFFGKIKNFFGGEKEEAKEESTILTWKKETSITLNLSSGEFNTENIPPEWQELFANLNLTKADMQNKDVVGIIVEEAILQQAKRQAGQEYDRNLQKRLEKVDYESNKEEKDY